MFVNNFKITLHVSDASCVRNMQSDLAVTNKHYCQSCILLVLCIIQTYNARKLKHKILTDIFNSSFSIDRTLLKMSLN